MMFSKNKRAQLMPLIQAVFSILILVTVVIVLNKHAATFPPLNVMPAQISLTDNLKQTQIIEQEYALTDAISLYDAMVFSADASLHHSKKVPDSCFAEKNKIVISFICNDYLLDAYKNSLKQTISESYPSQNHDVRLINKKDNSKALFIVQYSPLHDVLERSKTKQQNFVEDYFEMDQSENYAFTQITDKEFDILPIGATSLAYRYSTPITFAYDLSDEINSILSLDSNYGDMKKDITTILHLEKGTKHLAEWKTYLYGVEGEGEDAIQRVTRLTLRIQSLLESKHNFFEKNAYSVELSEENVVIILGEYPIVIEITY